MLKVFFPFLLFIDFRCLLVFHTPFLAFRCHCDQAALLSWCYIGYAFVSEMFLSSYKPSDAYGAIDVDTLPDDYPKRWDW